MNEGSGADWFAVRVKSRHEKSVALGFERDGIEQFLPLFRSRQRWSDRFKDVDLPLFPGYVFCRLDRMVRVPVLSVPGVIDFIRMGRKPATIDDTEIAALQLLMKTRLGCSPWPRLEVGERVAITSGPLAGLGGVLIQLKKEARLVLSVTLLQRSILVEIDRDWVTPVRNAGDPRPRLQISVEQPA